MNYDLNKLELVYNQNYEFVPKNDYKYIMDSKLLINIIIPIH